MKIVSEYLQALIEIGDVYLIDSEHYIITHDNSLFGIKSSGKDGGGLKSVRIFFEGMTVDDFKGQNAIVLNPFDESAVTSPEQIWFYESRTKLLGVMLRKVMETLFIAVTDEKSTDIAKVKIVGKYADKIDAKTVKKLKFFTDNELISIFYHPKSKTAQIKSDLFSEDKLKDIGSKLRKKDREVLQGVFLDLLATTESDMHSVFQYTGTVIGCQKADAYLHVFSKLLSRLDPHFKEFIQTDVNAEFIAECTNDLGKLYKQIKWLRTGTTSSKDSIKDSVTDTAKDQPNREAADSKPPWPADRPTTSLMSSHRSKDDRGSKRRRSSRTGTPLRDEAPRGNRRRLVTSVLRDEEDMVGRRGYGRYREEQIGGYKDQQEELRRRYEDDDDDYGRGRRYSRNSRGSSRRGSAYSHCIAV